MIEGQTVAVATDRVMAALVAGLEVEFGRGAGEGLAQRFLDAEEIDFTWEARREERWLGRFEQGDSDDGAGAGIDLDRVAIIGWIDGKWIAATIIVDGEGDARGLIGRRSFDREADAREAYLAAR